MEVKDKANVERIFADLLQIMRFTKANVSKAEARRLALYKSEAFCRRWAREEAFVTYFKREWGDKLGVCWLASCMMSSTAQSLTSSSLQRSKRCAHAQI